MDHRQNGFSTEERTSGNVTLYTHTHTRHAAQGKYTHNNELYEEEDVDRVNKLFDQGCEEGWVTERHVHPHVHLHSTRVGHGADLMICMKVIVAL